MKQLARAEEISSCNINPLFSDDEFVSVEVVGVTGEHEVSCVNGLWRCTCHDYTYRGVGHVEGSYTCKHILAVVLDLCMYPEKYRDSEQIDLGMFDFVDSHELLGEGK